MNRCRVLVSSRISGGEFTCTERRALIKLINLSHSISRPQFACELDKCHRNMVGELGDYREILKAGSNIGSSEMDFLN